jgi:NAD(P)-dependent dehydrogenase (short-subunit alcohol dehydrogenase family)
MPETGLSSRIMVDTKQVVLITGTSSGFGRLIAETLARKQFTVFATMRDLDGRNAKPAAELRGLAQRESLGLHVAELDVTRDDSAERCVAEVIAGAGRVDVLVNNAGVASLALSESFTMEQVHRIFETNFFGPARMIRAVLPQMHRQRSGLLLQVSSGAGRIVLPGMGFYCASKFALEALTEAYRYELASSGIDSVSIQPGAYPTEIFAKIESGEDVARNAPYGETAKIPDVINGLLQKSTADSQEIADAVLQIIETPAGRRELRSRVGTGAGGVESINAFTDQVQQQLLQAFGVAELTKFRPGRAATA